MEIIKDSISVFDSLFVLITIYCMIQSMLKGFTLSLILFSRWVIALFVTIILLPLIKPLIDRFIESEFVLDIGLGVFIFILSLFILIVIGKSIKSTITWSGLGMVDKTFGLVFGCFKGYIVCVCIFSLMNWFYPHEKWPISTKDTYSYQIVYNGSEFLLKNFPKEKDYINKIENI